MITQKVLDRLADVYQTVGWDIELHLGEPTKQVGYRKVRIYHNGKLVHTTLIEDDDSGLNNVRNLAVSVADWFETAEE